MNDTKRIGYKTRLRAFQKGVVCEGIASIYLIFKGYKILSRRYKTPVGELDIIAQKGDVIVFVEVKVRATIAGAIEAVRPKAQMRISKAARYFLADKTQCKEASNMGCRFDVVAVVLSWSLLPIRLRHITNAW